MNKKKKKIKNKKRKKINDSNKSYKKHQKIINKCEKILKNKKPIDDYYDNLFKKILENTTLLNFIKNNVINSQKQN